MIDLILNEETKEFEGKTGGGSNVVHKIDIKRVFLSDLMLLLNHNHNNCRYVDDIFFKLFHYCTFLVNVPYE